MNLTSNEMKKDPIEEKVVQLLCFTTKNKDLSTQINIDFPNMQILSLTFDHNNA